MTRKHTTDTYPRSGLGFSGQATVELALIFSVIALFLAGVADVARIYVEQQAVVHAAGVGARWLTIDGANKACSGYPDVESVVREDIGNALPQANIIRPIGVATPAGGTPAIVTVTVQYTHNFFFGLLNNMPLSFTSRAAMPGSSTAMTPCPTNPTPTRTPYITPTPSNTPTVTPTPTSTPTNTPTNTFTVTPTPTNTLTPSNTPTVTQTPTNTPTSTYTRTPTPTPTPQCPYLLTVDGYKNQGLNSLYVRVSVNDSASRPMPGLNVTVQIISNGQSASGVTDVNGAVCLVPGQDAANKTDFQVTVSGGPCPTVSQRYTSQFQSQHGCP